MTKKFSAHLALSLLSVSVALGCSSSRSASDDSMDSMADAGPIDHDAQAPPVDEVAPDAPRPSDPDRVITDEDWQAAVRSLCDALDACGGEDALPLAPEDDEGFEDEGSTFDELCDDPTGAGSVGGDLWRLVFESQACASANTLLLECGAAALDASCVEDEDEDPCAAEEQLVMDSCSWAALGSE
ncbi:MAG: hypothetical protein KF901_17765 [Myxococcales bacterium]|nr:hypothetical protein [Myxococcales bacterium]